VRDDSGYRESAGSGCASCAFSDLGKESIREECRAGAACLDLCEGIWYDVRTREALRITSRGQVLGPVSRGRKLAPGCKTKCMTRFPFAVRSSAVILQVFAFTKTYQERSAV
jgi:hypothetical protein